MFATDALPTDVWLTAAMRSVMQDGTAVYVARRGEASRGQVILRIDVIGENVSRVLFLGRDLDGNLCWYDAIKSKTGAPDEAREVIDRMIKSDPDAWVVEIESRTSANPFVDKDNEK